MLNRIFLYALFTPSFSGNNDKREIEKEKREVLLENQNYPNLESVRTQSEQLLDTDSLVEAVPVIEERRKLLDDKLATPPGEVGEDESVFKGGEIIKEEKEKRAPVNRKSILSQGDERWRFVVKELERELGVQKHEGSNGEDEDGEGSRPVIKLTDTSQGPRRQHSQAGAEGTTAASSGGEQPSSGGPRSEHKTFGYSPGYTGDSSADTDHSTMTSMSLPLTTS